VLLAFTTDSIIHLATNVVDALGLPGTFVLMLAESPCTPIPAMRGGERAAQDERVVLGNPHRRLTPSVARHKGQCCRRVWVASGAAGQGGDSSSA
jgi:hypothetical protein